MKIAVGLLITLWIKKWAREKGVNSDPGVGRKELRPTHKQLWRENRE